MYSYSFRPWQSCLCLWIKESVQIYVHHLSTYGLWSKRHISSLWYTAWIALFDSLSLWDVFQSFNHSPLWILYSSCASVIHRQWLEQRGRESPTLLKTFHFFELFFAAQYLLEAENSARPRRVDWSVETSGFSSYPKPRTGHPLCHCFPELGFELWLEPTGLLASSWLQAQSWAPSTFQAAAWDQVLSPVHQGRAADLKAAAPKPSGALAPAPVWRTQNLSVCNGDPEPRSAPLETGSAAEVAHGAVVRGLLSLFNNLNSFLENIRCQLH